MNSLRNIGKWVICMQLSLTSCTVAGRPTKDVAGADLLKRRPGAEIVEVRVLESEVVAIEFEVRYRLPTAKEPRSEVLRYIKRRDGSWELAK